MVLNAKSVLSVVMSAILTISAAAGFGFTANAEENTIDQMVEEMCTQEKIDQMIMPAFRNYNGAPVTSVPDDIKEFLGKHSLAGVCLFAENFTSTKQSVKLTDEFQKSLKPGSPQLFISADQEGGRVTRLNTGTQMPGNMALAATGDTKNAYRAATVIGKELDAIGINMNFAPVIDVNNNPSNPIIGLRSFSNSADIVADYGSAYLQGISDTGIIGTVKHFPGHGDTNTDSHSSLPCINKSYDELKKNELVPYIRCIKEGVDMVMTTHIQFPQIESEYVLDEEENKIYLPATLSKTIITDILRGDLGYNGVVVTDGMEMEAIAKFFGKYDAAARAINAGADILLIPFDINSPETLANFEEYIATLVKMTDEGEIKMENVDASVKRILTLKKKKGLLNPYDASDLADRISYAKSFVGCKDNHDIEWDITKKAITLVKNDDALPIDASEEETVILNHDSDYTLSTEFAINQLIKDGELSNNPKIRYTLFNDIDLDEAKSYIGEAKNVIIDNGIASLENMKASNLRDLSMIRGIIEYVHGYGGKVTVISYNLPYDVSVYQDADAIMVAYSARATTSYPSDYAESRVQYGPNVPAAIYMCMNISGSTTGILPVDIPKISEEYKFTSEILYSRGFGLKYPEKPEPTVSPEPTGEPTPAPTGEPTPAPTGEPVSNVISSDTVTVTGLKDGYKYTGKNVMPVFKLMMGDKELKADKDYRVSYKNNKKIGTASIEITGIGDYSGTLTINFKIVPKGTKLKSVKGGKNSLTIKWKKLTKQITGYQIRYSTDKKFSASKTKTVTIKSKKKVSKKLSNLQAKKRYYVQIRTYKLVNGKKYFSDWSKSLKAKTNTMH